MNKPRVLLTRRLPEGARRRLCEADLEVVELGGDEPVEREQLLRAAAGCAGLISTVSERVDEALLDAAGPALRVVANFAVGVDNIAVEACTRRGVRVTNTPDVLTDATADLTWALILAVARRLVEGDRLVRAGQWPGWAPLQLLGLDLRGATLGVVGAGRIGSAVARRAAAFGTRVLYKHPRKLAELERSLQAERADLDRLLRESDIVTLHVPARPENRRLLGAEQLGAMKSRAILINTSRGSVVDEGALVDALRRKRIAGAGLDVYENEPKLAAGLAELPNVVLAPHLGSATVATRERMAELAAQNAIAVLRGTDPPNPVNTLWPCPGSSA